MEKLDNDGMDKKCWKVFNHRPLAGYEFRNKLSPSGQITTIDDDEAIKKRECFRELHSPTL